MQASLRLQEARLACIACAQALLYGQGRPTCGKLAELCMLRLDDIDGLPEASSGLWHTASASLAAKTEELPKRVCCVFLIGCRMFSGCKPP